MVVHGRTTYTAECPIRVERPIMLNWWEELTYLHWPYDPDRVQALLPEDLTVETYGDRAWVGLIPFRMGVRPPIGPEVPWLTRFWETNVRTYVTAPDGTNGVWFHSLDASRLPAVATARLTYRLPYFWSSMSMERAGDRITYRCRRRWPGPRGARSLITVEIGRRYEPSELTDFDHYLSARWRLYSTRPGGGLRSAEVAHGPWPLHRATVVELDDELVRAAGLPAPIGEPIVHWSPGVEVRIGTPRRVAG